MFNGHPPEPPTAVHDCVGHVSMLCRGTKCFGPIRLQTRRARRCQLASAGLRRRTGYLLLHVTFSNLIPPLPHQVCSLLLTSSFALIPTLCCYLSDLHVCSLFQVFQTIGISG